jgi:hypothetical protein
MRAPQLIIAAFTFCLITACSNEELYTSGQEMQKSQCIENSNSVNQYEECVNAEPMSYEDYEAERKDALSQ